MVVVVVFVEYLLLFFFLLALPRGMWDLRSLTRDQTHPPAVEAQSPNHWVPGKSPVFVL